jgi:hypothetical protein
MSRPALFAGYTADLSPGLDIFRSEMVVGDMIYFRVVFVVYRRGSQTGTQGDKGT